MIIDEAAILPCPNCEGKAEHYPNSSVQANAIYCTMCPLGVEEATKTDKELLEIWNSLPRRTK